MQQSRLVEVTGNSVSTAGWDYKATNRWTGKVFIAIDPGEGAVRSKGVAVDAQQAEAA